MTILLELTAFLGLVIALVVFVRLVLWCLECTMCTNTNRRHLKPAPPKQLTISAPKPESNNNNNNTQVKKLITPAGTLASPPPTILVENKLPLPKLSSDIELGDVNNNENESIHVTMERSSPGKRTQTLDGNASLYDNVETHNHFRDSVQSEPVSQEERLRQTMVPLFAAFKNPLPAPPPRPIQPKPNRLAPIEPMPAPGAHMCICTFCSSHVPGLAVSTHSLVESLKSVANEIVVIDIEENTNIETLKPNQTRTASLETLEALEKLDEAIDEFNKTVDKVQVDGANKSVEQPSNDDQQEQIVVPSVPARSNSIQHNPEDIQVAINDKIQSSDEEEPPEVPPRDYEIVDAKPQTVVDDNVEDHAKLPEVIESPEDTLNESVKEFNEQVTRLVQEPRLLVKRHAPPPPVLSKPEPKLVGIRFADGHVRSVRLKQSRKIREILQQLKEPGIGSEEDNEKIACLITAMDTSGTSSLVSRSDSLTRRRPVQENLKYFQSLQTQVEPPQCAIYTQLVNEIKGVTHGNAGRDAHS